jgi:hypothetical protein
MADKDKSPAKPAKTQYEINKEMLDEMAGKPGTPVKPPKSMAKLKDKIDKELPPPLDSKIAGQLEPSDKAPAPKWDAYSQGEWRCNDCDTTFKHFQPLLSGHMKQHGHNFSLYDRETGEKKASSLSEARSGGHFGNFSKGGKAKKRKNKPAQSSANSVPPVVPPEEDDDSDSLHVDPQAKEEVDQPEVKENRPPSIPPRKVSSFQVNFVQETAPVDARMKILYDLIVNHPVSKALGYVPTLGQWIEETITEYYKQHGKIYGIEYLFKSREEAVYGERR